MIALILKEHRSSGLARDLDPRDNVAVNRATKEVPALRVTFMESDNRGSNPKSHEVYHADCLEDLFTTCIRNGIAKETTRTITNVLNTNSTSVKFQAHIAIQKNTSHVLICTMPKLELTSIGLNIH